MSNFQRSQRSASAPEARPGLQAVRASRTGPRTLEQQQADEAKRTGVNLANDLWRSSKSGMQVPPTLVVDAKALFDISGNLRNLSCWQPLFSGFIERDGQIKIMARDRAQFDQVQRAISGAGWDGLKTQMQVHQLPMHDVQGALQSVLNARNSHTFLVTTDPTIKQMVAGQPGLLMGVERGPHSYSSLMYALVQKLQAGLGLYQKFDALTAHSVQFSVTSDFVGPQSLEKLRDGVSRPVVSLPPGGLASLEVLETGSPAARSSPPRKIPVYPAGTGPGVPASPTAPWPRPGQPAPVANQSVSPVRNIETAAASPPRPNADLIWGPEQVRQPQSAAQRVGPQLPGVAAQVRTPVSSPSPQPLFVPPAVAAHSPQSAARIGPRPLSAEPEARIPERVQSFKPVASPSPLLPTSMRRTRSAPALNLQAHVVNGNGMAPKRNASPPTMAYRPVPLAASPQGGPARFPQAPVMRSDAMGRAYSLPSQVQPRTQHQAQFQPVQRYGAGQAAFHHGRPLGPLISMAPGPVGAVGYAAQAPAGYPVNGYGRLSASPPRQALLGVPYAAHGQRMNLRAAYPQSPVNPWVGGAIRTGAYIPHPAHSPASPPRRSVWG